MRKPFKSGDVVDLGSGVTWKLSERTARGLNRLIRPSALTKDKTNAG